jgi:hypothetical protein
MANTRASRRKLQMMQLIDDIQTENPALLSGLVASPPRVAAQSHSLLPDIRTPIIYRRTLNESQSSPALGSPQKRSSRKKREKRERRRPTGVDDAEAQSVSFSIMEDRKLPLLESQGASARRRTKARPREHVSKAEGASQTVKHSESGVWLSIPMGAIPSGASTKSAFSVLTPEELSKMGDLPADCCACGPTVEVSNKRYKFQLPLRLTIPHSSSVIGPPSKAMAGFPRPGTPNQRDSPHQEQMPEREDLRILRYNAGSMPRWKPVDVELHDVQFDETTISCDVEEPGVYRVVHSVLKPQRVEFVCFVSTLKKPMPGSRVSVTVWLHAATPHQRNLVYEKEQNSRSEGYWVGFEEIGRVPSLANVNETLQLRLFTTKMTNYDAEGTEEQSLFWSARGEPCCCQLTVRIPGSFQGRIYQQQLLIYSQRQFGRKASSEKLASVVRHVIVRRKGAQAEKQFSIPIRILVDQPQGIQE